MTFSPRLTIIQVCGAIVEELVFALPPILVLTITASVAAKLKDSLTAVILRAIQNYMEKAQPTLLSGLTHALVHGLHNALTTGVVHSTAPPLTHAPAGGKSRLLCSPTACTRRQHELLSGARRPLEGHRG